MTPKQLMEQWFIRVWGNKDPNAVNELMADDCEVSGLDLTSNDKRGYQEFHKAVLSTFENLNVSVESMKAIGNDVSGSGRFSGVNESTREKVELDFTYRAIWENGRLRKANHKLDYLTMVRDKDAPRTDG